MNRGGHDPMVDKRNNGAAILQYTEEVPSVVQILTHQSDSDFSVKMRLGGENPAECLALAPILNDLPISHITMHPRVGKQQYKGEVDLNGFAAFADVCQHPLLYNGDIRTIEEIEHIQQQFPQLSGIMIGRGLLANPALALDYQTGTKLCNSQVESRLKELHQKVFNQYEKQIEGGEAQLVNKLKTFWEYLEPMIRHKSAKRIHKSKTLDNYLQEVNRVEVI